MFGYAEPNVIVALSGNPVNVPPATSPPFVVTTFDAQEAVPNNEPVNDVACKLPVIPYEPVSCFEFIQTEPLFTSKSPYDEVVVLSIIS